MAKFEALEAEKLPATEAIVQDMAKILGETEEKPLKLLRGIVAGLGEEIARNFLAEAQRVEEEGGLMLPDESRRRTLGGVFFFLVKHAYPPRTKRYIRKARKAYQEALYPDTIKPKKKKFTWPERLEALEEIGEDIGGARSVKITLIGRPGKVVFKDTFVLTTMANMKPPTMAKGMPAIPNVQTKYLLIISRKQWTKVATAILDVEDELILEGFAVYDSGIKGMAVFVTVTNTKKTLAATREAQRAKMLAKQQATTQVPEEAPPAEETGS